VGLSGPACQDLKKNLINRNVKDAIKRKKSLKLKEKHQKPKLKS
jgi:hypothetical protein